MNVFHLERVMKKREGFALGPLDLDLSGGEILGVMGPNGAGKTTLLKLLWGFLRPDDGRVSVFGQTPHLRQIQVRQHAGYMPESMALYDWMTTRQFLDFISGFYPAWDPARAAELTRRFELNPAARIRILSKGARVRLGLTAALAHRPRLLILDEPTAGLDPLTRRELLDMLATLARDEGVSIVLSSHISNDLDRIADTVLMLHRGQVVAYAPTATLLARHNQTQLEEVFLHAIGRISPHRPPDRA